ELYVFRIVLHSEKAPTQGEGGDPGGARAAEGIEDDLARIGGAADHPIEEGEGLLGRMAAMQLLPLPRRRDAPYDLLAAGFRRLPVELPEVAHLLAAVFPLHLLVVEGVGQRLAALRRRPDEQLRRVGEEAAGEVRRTVRFE